MKALLNKAIDKFQATFPPNRIVAILTPIAFMPASAWLSAYLAKTLPYLPQFSTTQILVVMGAGALAALGAANRWLNGWQKHEFQTNDFLSTTSPYLGKHKKPRAK